MNHHGSPARSVDRMNIMSGAGGGSTSSGGIASALVLAKDYEEGTSDRVSARRREQYRQLRAHVHKEDGRLQAYGWSLPVTSKTNHEQHQKHSGGVPVPVPVYCNPLAEANPHMKVFCAAGVNLNGGYTKDGGCVVGASVFYSKPTAKITEITSPTTTTNEHQNNISELDTLDRQITMTMESPDPETQLSSYVWICTSTHNASTVTVINANEAATVLDAFPVCQTHLLCIASVAGALEKDYAFLENSEIIKAGEMLEKPGDGPDEIGKVEFIRLKKDKNTTDTTTTDVDNPSSSSNGDDKKRDQNENTETKEDENVTKQNNKENNEENKNETQQKEKMNSNETEVVSNKFFTYFKIIKKKIIF